MRFYKFRSITDDLAKDRALEALVGSFAIFSSRKNFNDLFDSKIDIPHPTPRDISGLLTNTKIGSHSRWISTWISNGAFTTEGINALDEMRIALNEMIDSYPIFSLSCLNDCHLLWAHYASNHAGFCIEFEFPDIQPKQVLYREHIESIPLLDFVKARLGLIGVELGNRVHDALHVKTNCWAYEGEYRWIAGNEMGYIPKGSKFLKFPYDPRWVKAIIFGCRTPIDVKRYILEHLPFKTDFKQAIEARDRIEIVSFNEHTHL